VSSVRLIFRIASYSVLLWFLDNTNRDKATRAEYIEVAKRLKCPIRCVYFDVLPELAWHNNMYRAFHARVEDADVEVVEKESIVQTSTVVEEKESSSGSEGEGAGEEGKPKKNKGRQKKTTTTTVTTTTATATTKASAPRELVPWLAYTTFRARFEEPELSEGFDKLDRVGFVFEGSEEERERWNAWIEL
jgi:bifunctional polynucleotide phosphatase/kinase